MVAKGFRKNYFRLSAITATSNAITLHKKATIYCNYHLHIKQYEFLDDPPEEEESVKPCFCNIFFACQAHKVLKLSKIKKPPLCKCRYTKTGIAPPYFIF